MPWLPDTNIRINLLKFSDSAIERTLLSHFSDQIFLCSVVKAELWHGAQKYGRTDQRLAVLETLFSQFTSLPFDDAAAWRYALLRHELESSGSLIGPNDLQIAAICLTQRVTLVTSNTREFSSVPDLIIEDWSAPKD